MPHPSLSRRRFLTLAATAAGLAIVPKSAFAAAVPAPLFGFQDKFKSSIKIASVELLRTPQCHIVRTTSTDGAVGLSICSDRVGDFCPMLLNRVAPYFVGKDARDLESLIDGVYIANSNYKMQGLALWCPVSWVEFSILDMLGKLANLSLGQLLGGVVRAKVPVYMSSMRRDTTPQQEVDWVKKTVEQTGAKAIKLKIGGRMSNNADAAPGRSEKLVALARKTFGDGFTIYVDANGSYDSAHAIEVGKMLQEHNIAFFEEPCPWEEYEETKRVADALAIPVAGGEQDSSLIRFREMIERNVVDIVQPDMSYNGGLIRSIRVANWAAARKMLVTPHSPAAGPTEAYVIHFASRTPNAGPFHEYAAASVGKKPPTWCKPAMEVKDGAIEVPTEPGLGIGIDPGLMSKATRVTKTDE